MTYVEQYGIACMTLAPEEFDEVFSLVFSDCDPHFELFSVREGAVWEKAATPEPEPEMAVKEETAVPQTSEPPAPADAGAATTAEAATEAPAATGAAPEGPPPPDGFYWGATF